MLENQIAQQASAVSRPMGKLPGQPETNPREHCNAITTRSGKQLEEPRGPVDSLGNEPAKNQESHETQSTNPIIVEEQIAELEQEKEPAYIPPPPYVPPVPFPQRLVKAKLDKQFGKFLEVLKKLYINIPFTDALLQMPTYAKFLKDILSNKRKMEEQGTVALTEECSAIIQNKLPPKLKDPGSFSIPCSIGDMPFNHALCDLGASVSLMPFSVYKKLEIGELKPTNISLQLADRSARRPVGILEDVPVKVGKFYIPADFVILEMEEDCRIPVILGRPFLATSGALIDAKSGKLTLRIGDDSIDFDISTNLKSSSSADTCHRVDTIVECYGKLEAVDDMSDAFARCFAETSEKGNRRAETPSNTITECHSNIIKSLKELVMVFNPRTTVFTRKPRPTWSGPFRICGISSDGVVELKGQTRNFKVAKERIKNFNPAHFKGQ